MSRDEFLDLVRQYGDARCLMGIGRDYTANTEAAGALFDRIAALVAQPGPGVCCVECGRKVQDDIHPDIREGSTHEHVG